MRSLSPYEAVIVARAEKHIYHTFVVGARYTVPLTIDKVLDAITILCQRYPHFSLRVGPDYTCTYTEKSYTIDDKCVEVEHVDNINAALDKYNLFKFDYRLDSPLWRVLCADSGDGNIEWLYFIVDHTYFDGTAAKNFHERFAATIGEIPTSKIINPKTFPSYPDPTEMMQFDKNATTSTAAADSIPAVTIPLDSKHLTLPMSMHGKRIVHLGANTTARLLALCRSEGIRITAYIYSIAVKALFAALPKTETSGRIFKTMIPINTRPQGADPQIVDFGLFFGKYFHSETSESIATTSLFDIARSFHNALQEGIPKAMHEYESFNVRALADKTLVDASMVAMAARNDSPITTIAMSNIGAMKTNLIDDVYFDQPLVDSYFAVHFLSSAAGGLVLNFESHRAIPDELLDSFVKNALDIIGN